MSIKRYDSDTKELNDVAGVYRLEGGGSTIEVDDELSTVSENPVQNKIITGELNKKLTEVSVMPQNPTDKQRVLFVGETAGEYVKGTIYEYSETQSKWNPISTAEIEVDDSLDSTSDNPLKNKVIVSALGAKQPIQLVSAITLESHSYDTVPTALSALATRLEDTYKKNQVDTAMNEKQPVQLVSAMILESNPYTTVPTALSALATRLGDTYTKNETDLKTAGLLNPKGTVTFVNLPTLAAAEVGDMYNVSNEFTTTSDFEEGAGEFIPAGANVYKTSGGKWDILAGSPVTGIKGEKEANYRRGNVNITPANIGAYSKNESDATTATIAEALDKWYIPDSFTATIDFYGYGEPSYLDATENADKNYLDQSSGWVYNAQERTGETGVYEWIQAVQFTATKNEKLNADKQDKTLSEPIIVDGVEQTTVEDAISAINEKEIPQSDSTTVQENSALLADNASKNLLENMMTTKAVGDLTFTRNNDDTITVSGKNSTADNVVENVGEITLPVGLYFMSGCPNNGSEETYHIKATQKFGETTYGASYIETGNGVTFVSPPFSENGSYGSGISDNSKCKLQSLAYGNGVYVAVGSNASSSPRAYWSNDGKTWTGADLTSTNIKSVVFSEKFNKFFAVGLKRIYQSTDGKQWELIDDSYDNINNVINGKNENIIISCSDNKIIYSDDGINFQESEIKSDSGILNMGDVAYGNGVYCTTDGGHIGEVYWSVDGVNWKKSSGDAKYLGAIVYGNGAFIGYSTYAAEYDGGDKKFWNLARSYNGKTWENLDKIESEYSPSCIKYVNGIFMRNYFVNGQNEIQLSFDDCKTWHSILYLNFDVTDIAYSNGRYVFVGYSSESTNKAYWNDEAKENDYIVDIVIKSGVQIESDITFPLMVCHNEIVDKSYVKSYKTNKILTDDVTKLLEDIQSLMSKIGTDALKTVAQTLVGAINENADSISALSDNKVDKVTGKVLSTNDFTDTLKTKLDGIAAGANKITVDASMSSTSTNPVQNKVVQSALNGKVDVVSGKALSTNDFTNTLKSKLDGIASGAEVNVQADWNTTTTTDDSYIKNKPNIYLKSETYNRTEVDAKVAGLLNPMGTAAFANLPTLATANVGDMYNVSDQFTTTSDFAEGAGVLCPAGSNVYKTADGKWDVLAGSPVTGIKGDGETTYRKGNVNITKENIGLGNVDNTADADKSVKSATTASKLGTNAGTASNPVYFSNGVPVASNFKMYTTTKATYDGNSITNTSGRQYRVVQDKSGYASVNVPFPALTDSYDVNSPSNNLGLSQQGAKSMYDAVIKTVQLTGFTIPRDKKYVSTMNGIAFLPCNPSTNATSNMSVSLKQDDGVTVVCARGSSTSGLQYMVTFPLTEGREYTFDYTNVDAYTYVYILEFY